jgi:hypothetical protein
MCGACGVAPADPRQPVDASMLERMTSTLRHRARDRRGFHRAPGVGLGVQRLSIIDRRDRVIRRSCRGEVATGSSHSAEAASTAGAPTEIAICRFACRRAVDVELRQCGRRRLTFLAAEC